MFCFFHKIHCQYQRLLLFFFVKFNRAFIQKRGVQRRDGFLCFFVGKIRIHKNQPSETIVKNSPSKISIYGKEPGRNSVTCTAHLGQEGEGSREGSLEGEDCACGDLSTFNLCNLEERYEKGTLFKIAHVSKGFFGIPKRIQ